MSEIVLVTQNDEPALAFGEYEISADGNTLYVGSAGVGDGSSEVIYKGISPAKIKYGVFSRLQTIANEISTKQGDTTKNYVVSMFSRINAKIIGNVVAETNKNVLIREEITRDVN